MKSGTECDGCRFCCWSFNVHDVPDPITRFQLKPARQHCSFECSRGCGIHHANNYPEVCRDFVCPYLDGEDIHRPDELQSAIEELAGNVGSYIPAIPSALPVEAAVKLLRETRSLPAFILIGNEWARVLLSLDREDDRTWRVKEESVMRWTDLFRSYGTEFNSTVKPGAVMA